MVPLFSKVDFKKLWHDVQNEETLICAKFGKDLFNIYLDYPHIYINVKSLSRYKLLAVSAGERWMIGGGE